MILCLLVVFYTLSYFDIIERLLWRHPFYYMWKRMGAMCVVRFVWWASRHPMKNAISSVNWIEFVICCYEFCVCSCETACLSTERRTFFFSCASKMLLSAKNNLIVFLALIATSLVHAVTTLFPFICVCCALVVGIF